MEDVGQPGVGEVGLPAMRAQVFEALRSLSDVNHQRSAWGKANADGSFDDLWLNIHILYDDCQVLPDPERAVPAVLRAEEVDVFRKLEAVLGPLLDDLGTSAEVDYLNDERWAMVVSSARAALLAISAP